MKKLDIARQLARRSRVSPAEAADRLDRTLQQIISDLRRGKPSLLPGLGSFRKLSDGRLAFERQSGKKH